MLRLFPATSASQYLWLNPVGLVLIELFSAVEWNWKLDKTKIKRELDAIEITTNYYIIDRSIQDFKEIEETIIKSEINKIVIVKSEIGEVVFPFQELSEVLQGEEWVDLIIAHRLKNKTIYIFEIKK